MDKSKWWVYPVSVICFVAIVLLGPGVFRIIFSLLNIFTPKYFQRDSYGIIFISEIATALSACQVLTMFTEKRAEKFSVVVLVVGALYLFGVSIWNFSLGILEFVDIASFWVAAAIMGVYAVSIWKKQILSSKVKND